MLGALRDRPLSTDQAGAVADLGGERVRTLLKAAASLDLVELVGADWALGRTGAALLATPGLDAMIASRTAELETELAPKNTEYAG